MPWNILEIRLKNARPTNIGTQLLERSMHQLHVNDSNSNLFPCFLVIGHIDSEMWLHLNCYLFCTFYGMPFHIIRIDLCFSCWCICGVVFVAIIPFKSLDIAILAMQKLMNFNSNTINYTHAPNNGLEWNMNFQFLSNNKYHFSNRFLWFHIYSARYRCQCVPLMENRAKFAAPMNDSPNSKTRE